MEEQLKEEQVGGECKVEKRSSGKGIMMKN